jgi:hypothetical protein
VAPSFGDALAYIETVLEERTAAIEAAPLPRYSDPAEPASRRALLERLRNSRHASASRSGT